MADYLTSNLYGPGFADSDLDAASWYKAYQIAGAAVQGPESVASAQLAKTLPDILGRAFPGLTDFESLYRNLGIFGYSGLPAGALNPSGVNQIQSISRYEFNGAIPSTREYLTVIDIIREVMPGSQLFRAPDGKWKLILPDTTRTEASQSVRTITRDDLTGPLKIGHPDASQKLNSVTVTYRSLAKDAAEDSVTWPTRGGALDTYWLDQDGGVRLHSTEEVEGCHNRYAAVAHAANIIQMLRRPVYEWIMHAEGFLLEPGDVVRLQDSVLGLDAYVRVETVSVDTLLQVTCTGVHFDRDDYAWYVDEEDVLNAQQAQSTALGDVSAVTASADDSNLVTVAWAAADDESVLLEGYEVQQSSDSGSTWSALVTAGPGVRQVTTFVGIEGQTLRWRVRSFGDGVTGAWVQSTDLTDRGDFSLRWRGWYWRGVCLCGHQHRHSARYRAGEYVGLPLASVAMGEHSADSHLVSGVSVAGGAGGAWRHGCGRGGDGDVVVTGDRGPLWRERRQRGQRR